MWTHTCPLVWALRPKWGFHWVSQCLDIHFVAISININFSFFRIFLSCCCWCCWCVCHTLCISHRRFMPTSSWPIISFYTCILFFSIFCFLGLVANTLSSMCTRTSLQIPISLWNYLAVERSHLFSHSPPPISLHSFFHSFISSVFFFSSLIRFKIKVLRTSFSICCNRIMTICHHRNVKW